MKSTKTFEKCCVFTTCSFICFVKVGDWFKYQAVIGCSFHDKYNRLKVTQRNVKWTRVPEQREMVRLRVYEYEGYFLKI